MTQTDAKTVQKQYSKDNSLDETIQQTIKVCQEARDDLTKSKKLYLILGGLIFMFLIGTVGFWTNNILHDILKLFISGLCFYYLIMGTIWNRMELNSLKAGLSALENFATTRMESKNIDS